MEFNGNCEILSCSLKIGPNSGYIKCNEDEYLLWDQWCHYERLCTKLNFSVKDICKIEILDKKVDYSSCRRNFNFDNVIFEFNLISIYYIGDTLEFIQGC